MNAAYAGRAQAYDASINLVITASTKGRFERGIFRIATLKESQPQVLKMERRRATSRPFPSREKRGRRQRFNQAIRMSDLDQPARIVLLILLGVTFVILWRLFIDGLRQGAAPLRERAAEGFDLNASRKGALAMASDRASSSFMRGIKLRLAKDGRAHHGGHSSPNHDVV